MRMLHLQQRGRGSVTHLGQRQCDPRMLHLQQRGRGSVTHLGQRQCDLHITWALPRWTPLVAAQQAVRAVLQRCLMLHLKPVMHGSQSQVRTRSPRFSITQLLNIAGDPVTAQQLAHVALKRMPMPSILMVMLHLKQ